MCFEGEAKELGHICDWTRELTNQPGGSGFSRGDFFLSLVLADKADRGSLGGTTEATEIPQFWCKVFEMPVKGF